MSDLEPSHDTTPLDSEKGTVAGEGVGVSTAVADATVLETEAATAGETEEEWFKNVYQGDKVPQLTVRAVLMGGILGALMSISNLYTSIKIGWAFGVAITACVLSYVIWNSLRTVFPKLTPMSILENNCMQSTASSAGYSTGATIGTAFGALLLITGHHQDPKILFLWTLVTAALGVFLAVPMKRQMINKEKLAFPSGIAAAETLKSLYSESKEAIMQAHALVKALAVGAFVGFLKIGEFKWQEALHLKLPDLYVFPLTLKGVDISKVPGFGFDPSVLLLGAGMIVGLRVSATMLVGSLILYLIVGPEVVNMHEIPGPEKLLKGWALWTGTALMVTSGLTAFALQWKTILRSFTGFKSSGKDAEQVDLNAKIAEIEVPFKWLVIGLVPLTIAMVVLQYVAFSIAMPLGLLAVVLSFFLALVACRATGETDITPIGAMGKLTQLSYAVLSPSNITTNLMAGSVTANIASSSADLLTDLKSGYILGANPRQQFIAQFIGLFFGSISIVPAFYLMIPTAQKMEEYNAPSANMWKAVAEALSKGIEFIPLHAREGLVIGGLLGILLAVIEYYAPPKYKKYLPSAMGLGLSWVVTLANSLSFFLGALLAFGWSKWNKKSADMFVIPVASGAVAGESLVCALLAIMNAVTALMHKS